MNKKYFLLLVTALVHNKISHTMQNSEITAKFWAEHEHSNRAVGFWALSTCTPPEPIKNMKESLQAIKQELDKVDFCNLSDEIIDRTLKIRKEILANITTELKNPVLNLEEKEYLEKVEKYLNNH